MMKVSMKNSSIAKKVAPFVITAGVIAGVGLIDTDKALGHGYVSNQQVVRSLVQRIMWVLFNMSHRV